MASPQKTPLELLLTGIQEARRDLIRLQFATSNFIAKKRRKLDQLERRYQNEGFIPNGNDS